MLARIGYGFLVILILLVAFSVFVSTLPFYVGETKTGFLEQKQAVWQNGLYRIAFFAHISAAILVLVLGLFQIWKFAREKWSNVHKVVGWVYVLLVLVLAAPGGFVMAYYCPIDAVSYSFLLMALCWFAFSWNGLAAAIQKKYTEHSYWMWRSYALSLAAVTLRLYLAISSGIFDWAGSEAYSFWAWACWIPNLVLVEFWINKSKNTLNGKSSQVY